MARDLIPLIRRELPEFTVDRRIGRGGAAQVFLARDASGSPVALKILHPELQLTLTAERFLREIRVISILDHPLIPKLQTAGSSASLVYYVMTYFEGPTLREVLDRRRRLSEADTVQLGDNLLDALGHAHARGLAHRDVKPENVIISDPGAVLLDFGIARAIQLAGKDKVTQSGVAVGSSAYMSPEQAKAIGEPDPRSDIYAVGCVLFECLAGRPPFVNRIEALLLSMHINEPVPDIRQFRPDTSEAVATALTRALAKELGDRWQTADQMRAALQQAAPGRR
jgi:serine/threonine-protein kinase